MKVQGLIIIGILLLSSVFAQDTYYKDYDWDAKPTFDSVIAEEAEHEVITKDKRSIEFIFLDGRFTEVYLKHRIVYIGTEKGIERNNRIYIPTGRIVEFVVNKARVIQKNGTVIVLDESDIKEAKDDENSRSYNYFALEGVEVGSYVEYLYVAIKAPGYSGKSETFQNEMRRKNVEFDLIAPQNLYFTFKSLNSFAEVAVDTVIESLNRWFLELDEVRLLKDELFAANDANAQAILYKLDENSANGSKDMTSFGEASKVVYGSIYKEPTNAVLKKLRKIAKETGVSSESGPKEKVRRLEDYIKSNYGFYDATVTQLEDLGAILINKVANDVGIVRLYANLMNLLDIKHQVVLTCNRMKRKFDPDFETYNYLVYYLFYFPEIDAFLDPTNVSFRLGLIPWEYTNNHGLFLKVIEIGSMKTAVGKVKFIPPLAYEKSSNNLYIDADLTGELLRPLIKFTNKSTGYYANDIQSFYNSISEDGQEKLRKSLMEYIVDSEEAKFIKLENGTPQDIGVNPLILKSEYETGKFIERAGAKILLKVGDLIGAQVEMYTEEKRVQGVENTYNRLYHREINITLPADYQATNLDVLNMDVSYKKEGKTQMAFTSEYKLEGNKISIVVEEFYSKIKFPVEIFDEYQKVMNAAADFNKKVLVIMKK